MKKVLFLLLFSYSYCSSAQELAPAIIASSGGFYSSDQVQLSWTLGGGILDSFSNGEVTLSSGVQVEAVDPFVLSSQTEIINVSVFPNPIQEQLTIQFDNTANYQIVISDLTGRSVYSGYHLGADQSIIDVSHLSIGAYALQILDSNQQPVKKFKLSKTR